MITIKSPQGGFVAIVPVASCDTCPFFQVDSTGYLKECSQGTGWDRIDDSSKIPDWCPAIAAAQDRLSGTADLEFLLNDAIDSLRLKKMDKLTPYMIGLSWTLDNCNPFTGGTARAEWFAGAIAALYGGSPGSDTPERFNQGYHWAQRYLKENPPPNRDAPSEQG